MRKLFVVFGLVIALGCSGIAEQLADMADVEVATGEDAVHPADFPLPPPAGGTIVQSMSMTMAGMKTVTVQYELATESDNAAVLGTYAEAMKAKGLEPVTDEGTNQVSTQTEGGGMMTAQIMESNGKSVLSLVSVTPPADAAPAE